MDPDEEHQHQQRLLPSSDDSAAVELGRLDGTDVMLSPIQTKHALRSRKPESTWLVSTVLVITIAGFVIQTEAIAYYEDILGWTKPFSSLYITHSALALPWICHILYLRFRRRNVPFAVWLRDYVDHLRDSIATVDAFASNGPPTSFKRVGSLGGPLDFLLGSMVIVTAVLTVSGVSWFVALALTTPGDLTAIYNCSAFFAAAFSVPLLRQRLSWAAMLAVLLSICGTFVIAYGDTTASGVTEDTASKPLIGSKRLLGNLISLAGAVAFGLYGVLFKKWASSSPSRGRQSSLTLTLAASALTGFYTFSTFWIGIIVLHVLNIEVFVVPNLAVSACIAISVIAGSSKSRKPKAALAAQSLALCVSSSSVLSSFA